MLLVDIKVWLFYCRSVLVDDDVAVIFVSVCYNHLWQAYVTKILWIVKNNWLKIHERIYFSETRHTSIMSSNLNTNSFLLYSLISFQMFKKINFFKSVNILLALGSLPIFFLCPMGCLDHSWKMIDNNCIIERCLYYFYW